MKFGLAMFDLKPQMYPVLARKADQLGYESLWSSDHLMPLTTISPNYPYSENNLPPFTPDWPWMDPWVVMSSMASITSRVKFGTKVYILPLRHPFVTARSVATLDTLSEGRAILGAGVGWWPEEFQAAGQDFENRGPRTTEITEILRRLWTEQAVEYHGKYYSFPEVRLEPKPVQQPIPIQFGGSSKAAMRRAAREGDGWIPTFLSFDQLKGKIAILHELRKEAGRADLPFDITTALDSPPTTDVIQRFEEIGVTRLFVSPYGIPDASITAEKIEAGLEQFANDVLSKFS